MRKIIINLAVVLALSLVLSVSAVSAASNLHFTLTGDGETSASGMVNIRDSISHSGVHSTNIRIQVQNLMPVKGMIYEVWLIDNDSQHHNSLGKFQTSKMGRGILNFQSKNMDFNPYDKILITQEPMVDFDPNPAVHVLSADIPQSLYLIKMKANLRGLNQSPKVITHARGNGEFWVDTKHNTVTYDVTYMGLESNETGAHVHGFADKGANAGVLAPLPMGMHKTGMFNYTENMEQQILAGMTYVNIHSEEYPAGEIRGQIELA